MKNYDNEIWQKIKFDNIDPKADLWCSNFGRVKSYRTNKVQGKILKGAFISAYNVVFVKLIDGTSKTLYVHKMVAEFFITPLNKNQEYIIHLDYDTKNNNYSNLQWADKEEVRNHAMNNPKVRNYNYARKLSLDDLKNISKEAKKLRKLGKAVYAPLARKYSVSATHIKKIVNSDK